MNRYDYVIVGSGIAGLYTALLAHEKGSVLIITKGSIDDCNTKYAQGGIAAPIGINDSTQLHFKDTMKAGDGLNDPEAVKILADEAPDRISDLVHFGVPFDTMNGAIALTMEAAHSVPRVLHAGGDATGAHIEATLSQRVREEKIMVLEYCLVTEIMVENGKVNGVHALDLRTGSLEEFGCAFLILATGGAGHLYKYTTNPDVATGDGIALAYQVGAELTDMEFYQ
ncbi:MAG: FAD-dependent oxidoreductase [Dehalococcoidales bacterium]|nr:FAD-dependent oxidoreductase [Dehalococcoidales bacterium]